ncbi:Centrosomal protein of 164 kDa [Hondaea fermentalgiana]|uniref:Centrosomal protein of 164 kDa n=1 Tax=Hondaea fermentalgiana TaxID=2315210 RepID=A0A2R5G6C8_9STRA|nr:Centrosomal protein of 164 kDa [Hondaea fermentalgiana]|eukprot:GBG26596.1 Centrosomal protein of 164 kDa [Hondaea fermentalgiana]
MSMAEASMAASSDECGIPSYSLEALRRRSLEKSADRFADPRKIPLEIPTEEQRESSRAMQEAVVAHAQLLGMDPAHDQDFFWIAEEALVAELEWPWVEIVDQASKKTYFLNEETHESTWNSPLDAHYRAMFERLRRERNEQRAEQQRLREEQEQYEQHYHHQQQNHHDQDSGNESASRSSIRLKRELERERKHHKAKKAEWAQRELRITRQAKRKESQLRKERDEWRAKLVALEQAQVRQLQELEEEQQAQAAAKSALDHSVELEELRATNAQLRIDLELAAERLAEAEASKDGLLENLDKLATIAERHEHSVEQERAHAASLDVTLRKTRLELELARENLSDLRAENAELLEQQLRGDCTRTSHHPRADAPQFDALEAERARCVGLESALSAARGTCEDLQNRLVDAERAQSCAERHAKIAERQREHVETLLLDQRAGCQCNATGKRLQTKARRGPALRQVHRRARRAKEVSLGNKEEDKDENEDEDEDNGALSDSALSAGREKLASRRNAKELKRLESLVLHLQQSEAHIKEVAAQCMIAASREAL